MAADKVTLGELEELDVVDVAEMLLFLEWEAAERARRDEIDRKRAEKR